MAVLGTAILTPEHPSLTHTVTLTNLAVSPAFVEIQIEKNVNPARLSVLFDLLLQDQQGEPRRLGQFGPFPSDNVGTFIVALPSDLKPGSVLELRMHTLDSNDEALLALSIAPFRFVPR